MRSLFFAITALFVSVSTVQAGTLPVVKDATAQTECSDCHMAYSAMLLPQASWEKIIGNLSNHFGEDASLDAATTQVVLDYYVKNSNDALQAKYLKAFEELKAKKIKKGKSIKSLRKPTALKTLARWSSTNAPDRIQDVARFKRKHGFGESCKPVIEGFMKRTKITTLATCSSCHAAMPESGSATIQLKFMGKMTATQKDAALSAAEFKCLLE